MPYLREVLQQVFSHAIKSDLVHERIITNEAYNTIAVTQPICCPSKKFHIGIIKLRFKSGL